MDIMTAGQSARFGQKARRERIRYSVRGHAVTRDCSFGSKAMNKNAGCMCRNTVAHSTYNARSIKSH